jgi:peptidoglycan hydrolase FlgJ
MNVTATQNRSIAEFNTQPSGGTPPKPGADGPELRQAFDSFVGETFFSQMLKSMRKTVGKPAYFHGGRTEEIFTQQLDQVLAEKLTASSADKLSGPMYELFMASRR